MGVDHCACCHTHWLSREGPWKAWNSNTTAVKAAMSSILRGCDSIRMIARACGLPEDTLYVEDISDDASAIDPYPVPKDVNTLIRFSVMPWDHLNYTLTW